MGWTRDYRLCILNHNQRYFGTYYRCINIAEFLSDSGLSVELITTSDKNFDLLVRKEIISDKLTIITLPRFKYGKYMSGQVVRLVITFFILLFKRYKIVYGFAPAMPQISIPAVATKFFTRSRLIFDWDDLWGGGFANEHHWLISKTIAWHETAFLKHADGISYASDFLGEMIASLDLNHKPIVKIENGCSLTKYSRVSKPIARERQGLSNSLKLIVSVGNTYTEGVLEFSEAISIILSNRDDVLFYFVGADLSGLPEGFLRPSFKDRVLFTGRKPHEEAMEYMYAADCLVLPMGQSPIEKARFPMRFADYLVSGCPIVSNASGEVEKYLKTFSAGFVAEPGNSQDFAAKIERILEDDELCLNFSRNQLELAENDLNNNTILKKLEFILK